MVTTRVHASGHLQMQERAALFYLTIQPGRICASPWRQAHSPGLHALCHSHYTTATNVGGSIEATAVMLLCPQQS